MLLGWNPVFIFLLLKSIGLIISGLKGWFYTNYYINYDNVKKHLSCYSSIYNYDFNKNAIDKTKFYDEDVKNLINFPVNADGNKRAYPERYISQFLIIFNDSQTKELHDLSTKPVYEIENIIIDMEKMFFLTCNIGCDVNTPIDDDFKQRIIDNYNVYSTNTLVNYKNEYKNFKNYQLNDENEATININISGNFNEYLTTILKIKIEKNSEIFINQIFSAFNVIYKNYLKRQQQKPDDMSITFLSELQSENTKISNTLIKQCYDIMISIIKSSQQAIIGDNIDSLKPQFDEIYNNQNNIDYRTQQIDTLLGYYLYQDNEEKFKDAYKYYEGQPHPDNDKSNELLELPESLLDTRDDGTKLDTLIKRQVNFQKAILDSYNNYLTGYAEKMKKMITTVTTMYNTAEFTSVYHEDYQLEGSYNRFKSILYFLELTRCGLTTNNFDIVLQSHYRLIGDVYHYYLPLVYPSTQEIMYGFCNFLNKNNKKFIWLCDKFNSEDLQKNFEYGSKLTFPISNIHTDNPICIIISPSHVEGFSFVYNPSLFIPALCKTSGDQEQVHGRILRKYGKESKKYSYDKSIYQYFGGNKDEQTYLNQICKIYQINQKHKFFNMNQKYKLPNKLDESKSSMGLDNKNLFMYVTQLIIKTVQSANSFIWSLPPEGLINKWYNEIVFSPGNEELLKLEMRRQPIVSDPQKAAEWVASWYYQYPSEETQLEKLYKTISIGQTLFELMVKEENDSFDKRLKTINPQDLIIAVKEYDSDSALNMDYCQLKNNSILCNSNLTQISIERDTDTEIKYVYTKKGLYKKIKNILDREIQTKFMSEKQTGKQESEEDIETKRKKYTDEILEEKKATGRDIEEELINAKKTQFKVIMDEFFGPEIAENKIQKINTEYNKIIHDNDGILSDEEKIEIYLGFLQDIFDQIQKNEEKIEEKIEGSTFLQTFIDDQIKIIEEYRKKSLAAQERALKQKFGGTRKNKNKNKKIKKTRRKR
jgi:hypothetical protein